MVSNGVITLSSESEEDSDVEIVGCYKDSKNDRLFTGEWVALGGSPYDFKPFLIDLTDPRWALPGPKRHKQHISSTAQADVNHANERNQPNKTLSTEKNNSSGPMLALSRGPAIISPVHNYDIVGSKRDVSPDLMTEPVLKKSKSNMFYPHTVELIRLPITAAHARESRPSVCITEESNILSTCPERPFNSSLAQECTISHNTTIANKLKPNPSVDSSLHSAKTLSGEGPVETLKTRQIARLSADVILSFSSSPGSPHHSDSGHSVATTNYGSVAEQTNCQSNPNNSVISVPTMVEKAQESCQQVRPSTHPLSPTGLETSAPELTETNLDSSDSPQPCSGSPCHSNRQLDDWTISTEHTQTENTPLGQKEVGTDVTLKSSTSPSCYSMPREPPLLAPKMEYSDEIISTGTNWSYTAGDSPMYDWQMGIDEEDMLVESNTERNFYSASSEDRRFVCRKTLSKLTAPPLSDLDGIGEEEDGVCPLEELCRQRLSVVYITIEVSNTEGTLQLLSDLLLPGFYLPRDITVHLLRDVLLGPRCPQHFCTRAFDLLMRTQSHRHADTATIPWDWEMLSSVMASQLALEAERHRCEVVRMLLEYVLQTMEDDFRAQLCVLATQRSVAKATLSCDLHFPNVRDVIKWLFAVIVRSTECGDSMEADSEKDELISMVSFFQRMLSMALEVDCHPTLSSEKLSEELFHMLISSTTLRAHRMLLLRSLQSGLLKCKLLEHLLDYACPLKTTLPMSLSRLLHFLENCCLRPDPVDGTDRWQKWEELVQLLWMLLLSYNQVIKGHLRRAVTERNLQGRPLIQTQHDMLSRTSVREAVESFLSRSKEDLGEALPFHVEESLTYLQDHLLDVCQS